MKVLTITLLVCAVATIQPAEAQLRFTVDFSEDGYAIQEGNNLTVTVDSNFEDFLQIPQLANLAVLVTVVVQEDANCEPGSDLLLPDGPNRTTARLVFNRSQTSISFDIQVPCDDLVEGLNQRCTLMFGAVTIPDSARNILVANPGGAAVLNIRECDDDYVECKWEQEELNVTEGTNRTVKLFSTCARRKIAARIIIPVSCVQNSVPGFVEPAVLGSDWTVGNTNLNFTDFTSFDTFNLTKSDEPIIITINDDVFAEPIESLICALQVGVVQSVRTVDPKQVTIVIRDDEVLNVSWAEELYIFNESVGDALTMLETNSIFGGTIGLAANPRMIIPDVTVNFESFIPGVPIKVTRSIGFTNYTGTLLGVGTVGLRRDNERDVEDVNPRFTFLPNTTSSSSNFTIFDDDVYEYDELIMADFDFDQRIRASFNTMKDPHNVTYILIKDDDTVEVCFAEERYTVKEREGTVAITLTVTGRYFVLINATVSCKEGNATTDDFQLEETTVRFPMPFSTSAAPNKSEASLNIAITDDLIHEETECFTCTIDTTTVPEKELLCPSPVTTICIVDPVLVRFNPDIYFVQEEEMNSTATITLETIGTHPDTINVTVIARDDSAARDSDYEGAMFSVSLPPTNDNISTVDFNITIIDDDIIECPEEFILRLVIPEAAALSAVKGTPDSASVSIMDNDVAQVSFSPQNYTVSEGTSVELIIVLDQPACQDISVTVTTMDGTAMDGVDYDGKSSVVSFQPGETRKSCPIATRPDTLFERNEYFKANLSHPVNGSVVFGTPTVAFVHITDDDEIPVKFNPDTYTVTEGVDANAVVYLEALQDHPRFGFNVTVCTQDESAVDGEDYRGGNFSVFFPPGENNISFNVSIINDDVVELDESFTLDLKIPEAAAALRVVRGSPDTATVNILDDDIVIISFSPQNYTVPEGSFVNLTIVADKVSPEDITVVVTTTDITTDPDDYDGGTLTCIIPQGQTSTSCPPLRTHLNVPLEDNEVFKATLSLPAGPDYARVGPDAFVTITDITVNVSFAQSEYEIEENSESVLIEVLARGNLSESNFNIPVAVTGGTATGGGIDYEDPTPATLFFVRDQASFSFQFIPVCDAIREVNENVMLTISVPPQYQHYVTTEQPSTTNVIIIDNCPAPPATDDPTIPVNDTVMADPLFTVPIDTRNTSDILEGTPLCYEVHGRNNTYLNLVSDDCTSVNAYTMEFLVEWQPGEIEAVNVIRVIGVVATDAADECHYIQVEVTDSGMCTAQVDGDSLDSAMFVKNNVTVYHKNNMVRIMVPNCEDQRSRHLVMWVRCQKLRVTDISGDEYTMTKFIISRGLKHRVMAHGLIGQFWGVPFTVVDREMDGENYTLTMVPPALPDQDAPRNRTFPAMLSDKTWSLDHKFAMPDSKCLYVGNSQGGPESSLVDSVIEGNWTDYITDSLYETNWTFSRYNADICP